MCVFAQRFAVKMKLLSGLVLVSLLTALASGQILSSFKRGRMMAQEGERSNSLAPGQDHNKGSEIGPRGQVRALSGTRVKRRDDSILTSTNFKPNNFSKLLRRHKAIEGDWRTDALPVTVPFPSIFVNYLCYLSLLVYRRVIY